MGFFVIRLRITPSRDKEKVRKETRGSKKQLWRGFESRKESEPIESPVGG